MISAGDVGGNFTIVSWNLLVNLSLHVLARHDHIFDIRPLYLEKKKQERIGHIIVSSSPRPLRRLWLDSHHCFGIRRESARLRLLEASGLEGG